MRSFRQYLIEGPEAVLRHLEHIEDLPVKWGADGTTIAMGYLKQFAQFLRGSAKAKLNVTEKFDGAPSLICGPDPADGRFFVASKSLFNKTPKFNKTPADIARNHADSPGLADKLNKALLYLKPLGLKEIVQGDVMFDDDLKKHQTIDGVVHVTFQPNTIVYAVPAESDLGKQITRARFGIVFHTSYTGTIGNLKVKPGVSLPKFKSPDVWIHSPYYRDVTGAVLFTADETVWYDSLLAQIQKASVGINKGLTAAFNKVPQLRELVAQYENALVKSGAVKSTPVAKAAGFPVWVKQRGEAEVASAKSATGQNAKRVAWQQIFDAAMSLVPGLTAYYQWQSLVLEAKAFLLSKLAAGQKLGTFLPSADGLTVTAPEGFVAVDTRGNMVKLVDRLGFSRANFTQAKAW